MAPKNNNFFGGLFDFNGDGTTDFSEQALAFMMFEEIMEGDKEEDSDDLFDDDDF